MRIGRVASMALAVVSAAAMLVSCSGEDATPIEPGADTTGLTTPHLLEPTDQMTELAEQQCLDDPSLEQGEVRAVDPANEEQVLAEVVVDCAEVRE